MSKCIRLRVSNLTEFIISEDSRKPFIKRYIKDSINIIEIVSGQQKTR
jgi:hypothetical protein